MPYLKGPKTLLRPLTIQDLEKVHTLLSLPETDQYNTLGIPTDIEKTKSIIFPLIDDNLSNDPKSYTLAIEDNLSPKFLGLIGLKIGSEKYKRGEVWFKIHPNYWNMGYGTEALRLLLDFAFDTLELHRIEAGCAVDNIGSIKVLEKCGMKREGRGRQVLPLKSGWSDNFEYAILESDE